MFGNDSKPTRIYRFGAKPPSGPVDEQARLAHRYRNRLIEIERDRRHRVELAIVAHAPDLAAMETEIAEAEARLGELRESVARRNAAARARTATAADREAIASARAQLKDLRAKRKARRKAAFEDESLKAAMKVIDAENLAARKIARAESGVYNGTYQQVEAAMSGARSGAPPKFRRWTGDAHLACQIQYGLTPAEILAMDDRRIQIAPPEKSGGWTVARVRIQSDEHRNPVWAELRVRLHRDMPADGLIKWAHLVRKRIGSRDEWSLQLAVSREGGFPRHDLAADGSVGIDIGWRLMGDSSIRAAYWVGSDGAEGELLIPAADAGRWSKADSLRAIRDRHFDRARDQLTAWLEANRAILPDWLAERTETIRQWRSQARLASVVLSWRGSRFDGDAEAFDRLVWSDRRAEHGDGLESWRKRDKHLWNWESSQRVKAANWRKDLYRAFAAMMSRRYRTAIVEATDWAKMQRSPAPEADDSEIAARMYRRIGAPGLLAQTISQRFAETVRVDPAYTTTRCSACGQSIEHKGLLLEQTCGHCMATMDQDRNAAINLLAAASGEVMAGA